MQNFLLTVIIIKILKNKRITQNTMKYTVMVPKYKMIGQELEFIIKLWVYKEVLQKN